MEIISAKGIYPKLYKDKFDGKNYSYAFGVTNTTYSDLITNLFGNIQNPNREKDLLKGLKRVNITWKEYEERKRKDEEIRKNGFKGYDWDYDNNPMYFHIEDAPERYGDDKLSTISYKWSDGIMYWAESCKDITYVYKYSGGEIQEEKYYSTQEIIEILEKWLEYIEKWNTEDGRNSMIEKYEREHELENNE